MEFEWDPRKALDNQRKHGVDFRLAVTIFDDPFALLVDDEKHSTPSEKRLWQIGESDDGILVVIFTIRPKGRIHKY